jgi:hypothetical protein
LSDGYCASVLRLMTAPLDSPDIPKTFPFAGYLCRRNLHRRVCESRL